MKVLPDTHLLLWAAAGDRRLSVEATEWLSSPEHEQWFSAASILEIAIKFAQSKTGFSVHPHEIYRGLLQSGYRELPITGEQSLLLAKMPRHHGDPFDRLLLAQAIHFGGVLLTADRVLAAYGGPVIFVG